MKIKILLFIAVLSGACNETSQKKVQQKAIDTKWQIKLVVTQKHFYTLSGLLDTTIRIENLYHNGKEGMDFKWLVSRKYDGNNNLLDEKTFEVLRGKVEILNEKIFKYDEKNNLLLETDKRGNIADEIISRKYNQLNQKVEEIMLRKSLESISKDWTIDSFAAHLNSKQTPQYDTSISVFEYDTNGNAVKQVYENSKHEIREIHTNVFSGKEKIGAFSVNVKGDTISVTNYGKDGSLTVEIRQNKLATLIADTIFYDGIKKIKAVYIDNKRKYKMMETFKYDEKGNEIETISYN